MNIEAWEIVYRTTSGGIPYVYIVVAVALLAFMLIGLRYWNNGCKIKFPKYFYMREGHLDKTIPALQKIVKSPFNIVRIDFSEVEDTTRGAYMVFLAQVEKAIIKKKSIRWHGWPQSKQVLNIIVGQKNYKHKNVQITSDMMPNADSFRRLEPDFIDEVVNELKRLGLTIYYSPFYDFLTELMGNATEHGIQHKNINWWMLRYRDPSKRCMRYVFVDMGLGIIKSYKESGLLRKYFFKDKKQIPLDIFYGRLGSSTMKEGRGRGLPQIREVIEKGFVSDFVLITNNVSLRYVDNEFVVSKNPNFVGTYYSWTISKENYIKWKSIL